MLKKKTPPHAFPGFMLVKKYASQCHPEIPRLFKAVPPIFLWGKNR